MNVACTATYGMLDFSGLIWTQLYIPSDHVRSARQHDRGSHIVLGHAAWLGLSACCILVGKKDKIHLGPVVVKLP